MGEPKYLSLQDMINECCCKENFTAAIWINNDAERLVLRNRIINYINKKYNIVSEVHNDKICMNNNSVIIFAVSDIGTLRCRVNAIAYRFQIKEIIIQQIILPHISYYFNKKKYFCLEPTIGNIYVIYDVLDEKMWW